MRAVRNTPNELILGLVSVSDRASRGEYRDEGIPALEAWCRDAITTPVQIHTRLIPDDRCQIEDTLRELADNVGCDLIFTTGGTGPARRDVTPEATLAVATREMPGFAEQMRRISLRFVPTAILSRQVAVLREIGEHSTLIVNLPGRPKSISETLGGLRSDSGEVLEAGLFASIPYCIELIGGPYIETDPEIIEAFRPKSARKPAVQKSVPPEYEQAARAAERQIAERKAAGAPLPGFSADEMRPAGRDQGEAAARQDAHPAQPAADEAPAQKIITARNAERGVPLYAANPSTRLEPLDVLVRDPVNGADPACTVIFLHGMGASPEDFASLAQDLFAYGGPAARFILPYAPEIPVDWVNREILPAWFNIPKNVALKDEDVKGLTSMHLRISQVINEVISTGTPAERIFLGGFSQGGAMSLYSGLRQARTLAGVFSLSGYLPASASLEHEITQAARSTPVFIAHGTYDSVLPITLAKHGAKAAAEHARTVIWREYGMDHELAADELSDLVKFMNAALAP